MDFEIKDIEFSSYGGYHSAYVLYDVNLSDETYRALYNKGDIQSVSGMTYDEFVANGGHFDNTNLSVDEYHNVEINLFPKADNISYICTFGDGYYSFHDGNDYRDTEDKLKLSEVEAEMIKDKVSTALEERGESLELDLSESVNKMEKEYAETERW